jgi:hypothetical protein
MARSQEKQPTKGIAMRRMLTFVAVSLVLLGLFSWPAMAAGDTVGVFVSATNYTLLKMPSGPNRTFHHGFTSGYPWDNIPFVCDFDGDGDDSIGYYSQVDGRFYIANKNQARVIDTIITYAPVSNPTGKLWPVVRRNNGATQVGVFDQATNWWYLKNGPSFQWGWGTYTGLIPVVGDWNGDGIFTVGLYNPTLQKFRLNNNLPPSGTGMTITFGAPGAHPVIGDWNGDGLDDVGYYDLAAGVFHRNGYANVDFNYAILNEFKAPLPDNGYLQMYPVAGKWDASGELDLAPYSWDMTPPGDCPGYELRDPGHRGGARRRQRAPAPPQPAHCAERETRERGVLQRLQPVRHQQPLVRIEEYPVGAVRRGRQTGIHSRLQPGGSDQLDEVHPDE